MTIKDILCLDIPANFGTNEFSEITYEMSYVMDQLDNTIETKWGISQFVIINNEWDNVIKIPFIGGYYEPDDEDSEDIFEEWSRDYCQYSIDIYNSALKEGVVDIFAKTEVLGETINGSKIYTQEKIDIDCANNISKIEYSNNSFNKVKNNQNDGKAGWRKFRASWLAAAIDCYGEKFVNNFIEFCIKNNINDTHDHNYGYRSDGSPVIFDYASFDY